MADIVVSCQRPLIDGMNREPVGWAIDAVELPDYELTDASGTWLSIALANAGQAREAIRAAKELEGQAAGSAEATAFARTEIQLLLEQFPKTEGI